MRNIEKLLKKEDFKEFKLLIEKTFGCKPKENILSQDKKMEYIFGIEIKDELFKKTEIVVEFKYENKVDPFLLVDCKVITDGIYSEHNDRYFFAKYKKQFSSLFLSVEDQLIEWLSNKEGKLYLHNKITEKVQRFRTKYINNEEFLKVEKNYKKIIEGPFHKMAYKEIEKQKEKIQEETNALMKEIQKYNWENAVNRALDTKDFKELKKLSIHLE